MSISITREKVSNGFAASGINQIRNCREFEPGYGFQIGCVIKELVEQETRYQKELTNVCIENADKDEQGKPIIEANNYKLSDAAKKIVEEAANVSKENIISLNRPKLNLSKLAPAKLSAGELASLDWLIDETK